MPIRTNAPSTVLPHDQTLGGITGALSKMGTGFVAGVLDTPLVGGIATELATLFPGVDETDVRGIIRRAPE